MSAPKHPSQRPGRPAKPVDGTASAQARLGAQLRELRKQRDVTLIALGEMTGYSWQHLGAVERGTVVPSDTVVAACDRALHAGGRLVALHPAVIAEQAAHRHERTTARRNAAPPRDTDTDWPRLAALAGRQARVTPQVMDELEDITDRQRVLYHDLSSAQMLVPVEAHLGLLMALLESHQCDPIHRRLAQAAGEAAGFAAWIHFDLGDPHRMELLYAAAGDLLDESGDTALWSYVTGYRALTLEAAGLGTQALRCADQARHWAPRSLSRTSRAWLAAISASAAALVETRRGDVLPLLDDARDQLDDAAGREAWMYDFDHSSLAGHRGQCQLRLGNPQAAITAYTEGLELLPPGRERRGAQLAAGLAQAHLTNGDVTAACHWAMTALDAFAKRAAASGFRRVLGIRDQLRQTGHGDEAAEIDERVDTLLRDADA